MANKDFSQPASAQAPAYDWVAITANDATVLTDIRALYVGSSGDIAMVSPTGSSETFSSVPVGLLPVMPQIVKSTGTTASNIIGLK